MKVLASLLFIALIFPAYAGSGGEKIYLTGKDTENNAIPSILNDLPSPRALPCVNCHRESGFGASESGQTIPPVNWRYLGKNQPEDDSSRFYRLQNKRPAYDAESLHRLLVQGIGSNGKQIDKLMPRYALVREQSDSILEYLKTLYPKHDQGVDDSVLRVATIVDQRLPEADREQHVEFLSRLFDMKNSLTRGELKRKRFSPIQKVPQYESYRKWELVVWELPQDPVLWRRYLERAYQSQPVFMVLRPRVASDYQSIAGFCNTTQIPCLFPSGDPQAEGDFYNFVFRNRAKQERDYIAKQRRRNGDRLRYLNAEGKLSTVNRALTGLPKLNLQHWQTIEEQFAQVCSDELIVLTKAGAEQAKYLEHLSCDGNNNITIKVLSDEKMDYHGLTTYLREFPDSRICWVSDYHKVLEKNPRNIRVNAMVRRFGIENPQNEMLAMSLFAFTLSSEALHQMAGNFSRLYMMEILEHMLNSFINYTFFSTISGAPYQRYIVGPVDEYCPSKGKA